MDKTTFIRHYCANYRILEDKVIDSSDYVSIEPTNYATFSANYIFLLLSICSEIDSVSAEYCKLISADSGNVGGIINKIELIISKHPNLRNKRIDTKEPFERQSFVPFAKLEKDNSSWWSDYNKIKHNRTEKDSNGRYNYQKANLKNVLHAIASLYILLFLIGKEFGYENQPPLDSKLFEDYII
ncbi:MAG TPA: hypothetical protein PLY43_08485 [Ruminococcus sp.]|nr:hypothetical protein [Ruminococcus sp.]